jgi:acyl-CoA thioesterase
VSSQFARDTAIHPLSEGRFGATIAAHWSVGAGPNGGYTAALLLRAAIAALPTAGALQPRSFTAHLMGAPQPGACELHVDVDKAGRTAGFVRVRIMQHGATMATASVVFVRDQSELVRFAQRAMPRVASPEDLAGTPDVRRNVPVYVAQYDQRFVTPPLRGDGTPVVIAWTRFVDPSPFDPVALVAIGDSFPPPVLACSTNVLGALTLDYTVHFRAAKAPSVEDGFVLAEVESTMAAEGFVDEDVWLWSPDGTLLAQARQLGMIRPLPDKRGT